MRPFQLACSFESRYRSFNCRPSPNPSRPIDNWNRSSHPMTVDSFGKWQITLPPLSSSGAPAIPHDSKVKVHFHFSDGSTGDRVPAWATRVTQDLSQSPDYDARFWNPPPSGRHTFKHPRPVESMRRVAEKGGMKIYEAHVGIATPEGRVGTYKEFERDMLPRIKELGYNTIQMCVLTGRCAVALGRLASNFSH